MSENNENQNNQNEKRQENRSKVGGLWKRVASKSGQKYLGGVIYLGAAKVKVAVFPNDKSKSANPETAPDYNLVFLPDIQGQKRDEFLDSEPQVETQKPKQKKSQDPVKPTVKEVDLGGDDMDFSEEQPVSESDEDLL